MAGARAGDSVSLPFREIEESDLPGRSLSVTWLLLPRVRDQVSYSTMLRRLQHPRRPGAYLSFSDCQLFDRIGSFRMDTQEQCLTGYAFPTSAGLTDCLRRAFHALTL